MSRTSPVPHVVTVSPFSVAPRRGTGRSARPGGWAVAVLALIALTGVLALSGCGGGGGSQTDCGLNGCTIEFPRSGDAAVSVLGVEARLEGVTDGVASLEVAGQGVTVPVGGEAEVVGLTVAVQDVTDSAVTVLVRP